MFALNFSSYMQMPNWELHLEIQYLNTKLSK